MSIPVTVLDYGIGNQLNVLRALEHCGASVKVVQKASAADVEAGRLVLPGVGAFGDGMVELRARGFDDLVKRFAQTGKPFLGICVGMQLLATRGLEFGETRGLDWIGGDVRRIESHDPAIKIPHMGWNTLVGASGPDLIARIGDAPMYFTHSFAFYPDDENDVAAWVDHGGQFPAAVANGNIAGVQFHPEKSQSAGLALLARFLEWRP